MMYIHAMPRVPRAKTNAQIDREVAEILRQRTYRTETPEGPKFRRSWPAGRRYKLVNADTGEILRDAHDFEIDQIHASRGVVAMPLRSGTTNVALKDIDERFVVMNRNHDILGEGKTMQGAMDRAPKDKSYAVVRGEYTSDGTYWGLGHGRDMATRESRPSHGFRWYVS